MVERLWYWFLQSLRGGIPNWLVIVVVLALEMVSAMVVYALEPWNPSVVVGSLLELQYIPHYIGELWAVPLYFDFLCRLAIAKVLVSLLIFLLYRWRTPYLVFPFLHFVIFHFGLL
jgi:hypothetical protein